MELPDGNRVQAVAFLQPPGNIPDAVGAVPAEKIRQQAGGGDAVHIIVPKNGDFFAPGHGQPHPTGGQIHVLHQKRVVQRGVTAQIGVRLPGILNAPGRQDHGSQGRVSALHQRVDRAHFRFRYIPNSVFHKPYTSNNYIFSLLYQK